MQGLGLVTAYKTKPSLKRIVRKLFALPFLPESFIEVFESFRSSTQVQQGWTSEPKLMDRFDYVIRQWIRGTPLEVWNVYDRPGNMRTTNVCQLETSARNFKQNIVGGYQGAERCLRKQFDQYSLLLDECQSNLSIFVIQT